MNLDDYILPESVGTPSGISSPPGVDFNEPSHAVASAIPIKAPKEQQQHPEPQADTMPASFPHAPQDRHHEFDYVPKRVRKTSVDERNVSDKFRLYCLLLLLSFLTAWIL